MHEVIVIGGGIAGLAAAYEVHRRGHLFTLLEAESRAGGVVLSEKIEGFVVDAGPDALLVQKGEGIALCRDIGLGDRLVPTKPPRVAYVLRGGRLHALPPASVLGIPTTAAPLLRSRLFSWSGKLRMGAELFVPPRRDDADESIGEFMARRFGDEAKEYLAEPLLAGIHAGDVDRLSMRALFPRLVSAERESGSLLRAFRSWPRSADEGGPFRSLPEGLSEMVRTLVATLPPSSIRLNCSVREVHSVVGSRSDTEVPSHRKYVVTTSAGDRLTADAVIVAVPAPAAGRVLRSLDPRLAQLCGEVPYASTATVALAFPRADVAHPLNGSGFVVPRREGRSILAASWLSSKWPGRAPDGHVLIRAFIGGARDPNGLDRTDAQLVDVAMEALTPVLRITGRPELVRVYRWDRASAQHEVGHLARVAAIDQLVDAHPGLFLTGSGLRGVGIPDCVADGRAMARRAVEWTAGRAPDAVSSTS
jgi:oxygen-dependent protoporphyrinogen oxidase